MQEDQQPGQIIIPHTSTDAQNPPATQASPTSIPVSPTQPSPAQFPSPAVVTATEPAPATASPMPPAATEPSVQLPQPPSVAPTATPASEEGWAFRQEEDTTATYHDTPLPESVSWTAAQFVAHDKSVGWYVILALGGALAAAIIYVLTKDKITTGVVIFALLSFGIFASRKPRSEQYALTGQGVQVGGKVYAFHDFKTFSVADEGDTASVVFTPLKRFMPPLTIYVTPEIEDQVVDYLSAYLPVSEHKADAVDNLLRRIRF